MRTPRAGNFLLLGVAFAGLLPLGARFWWIFDLLTHFRLQYAALALTLAVVAAGLRNATATLALLAATALNVWPLAPYWPTSDAGTNAGGIQVLNFNVYRRNRDHARIVETVRTRPFDIVTLVELSARLDAAIAAEFPYRFTSPSPGSVGIGVLSAHPLRSSKVFGIGGAPGIDTEIELPDGRIRLLAVHLASPLGPRLARARNRQLTQLGKYIAEIDQPLLVCGDFNLSPYSPYFDAFIDAVELTDPRAGRGFGISWPTFMPLLGIPIDHCFSRGPLVVRSVERLDDAGSDHYPVAIGLDWHTPE